jgi:hypothetical protein
MLPVVIGRIADAVLRARPFDTRRFGLLQHLDDLLFTESTFSCLNKIYPISTRVPIIDTDLSGITFHFPAVRGGN